ncbi:hypothetical protein [Amycolatopsis sp. CA-230715]|uniref:hypothetical protein n=1 Tax=Amycolatopsis sp. CA-230715 TaxID=2745196 RepID=UPI001C025979|nr:hypothetical protein [Amycolatopsis sp. CA-230715]QWF79768.1 hypothetical protein HUW46_03180 [Amycolatopsis sp. CA-230715]
MAKNTIPGLKTGGGLLAKLIGAAVVIALLVLVVKYPGDAAGFAKGLGGMVSDAIGGIVRFFRGLG